MRQKTIKFAKDTQGVIENVSVFALVAGLVAYSIQKGLFSMTADQVVAVGSVGLAFAVFRFAVTR